MEANQAVHVDDALDIYLDRAHLERVTRHCVDHPGSPLRLALTAMGDAALGSGPFTVMDKRLTPPSGDKHDFLRMPTYAWPNPDTPDGLPYVIRDGQAGPGIGGPDYDMGRMQSMTMAVVNLAWASLASNDEAYVEKAAELLGVWFVDPATRMNPNLTYAKYTPGDTAPFPNGVIATHRWVGLVQSIGILSGSPSFADGLRDSLRAWFREFVQWLLTSRQGALERSAGNNRGTWYDAQVAAYSRFAGDDSQARRVLQDDTRRRLRAQVAEDGSLPKELVRTNSMGYSIMTLDGLSRLALIGDRIGVDLWHEEVAGKPSLLRAMEYVTPYIGEPERWPHEQIKPVPRERAVFAWCAASEAYDDPKLRDALGVLEPELVAADPAPVLFDCQDLRIGQ